MNRILVIEDQLPLRSSISEILSFEGFEVLEAENGEIGIKTAIQQHPDLILCDIMMPKIDGYQVLQEIKHHESTRPIPFYFLTAMAEKTDIKTGFELGADGYITKPFTCDELVNSVRSGLKNR